MRKIIRICLLILFSSFLIPVGSQAALPVFDLPHILETIYNGYQMYQSLQSSIKQLEYAYIQTQTQLKQLQQLDISSITNFREAVSLVDQQIDFVRKAENRFKSISVRVGETSVPLSQFYRIPGEAEEMVIADMTRNMSEWEKARAWSHYGLNPANYMYVKAWEGRLQDASKQMVVIDEIIAENNEQTAQAVEGIVNEAMGNESQLAVLQSMTALMQILIGEQQEANRLNALANRYQADKDKAGDMPVQNVSKFSNDWIE